MSNKPLNALLSKSVWTYPALGKALNTEASRVSRLVNGETVPTRRQVLALGNILGLEPAEVVEAWQAAGIARVRSKARELREEVES